MAPKLITSVDDLTPDPKNANLGTERGKALLAESIDTCGLGRSIVVDRHGVVIAGNKTLAAAKAIGAKVEVIHTDGKELVVVQRDDLNLEQDEEARQLAYYDNRVQQVDLSWSKDQITTDVLSGVEVGSMFFPEELEAIAPLDVEPKALPTSDVGLTESSVKAKKPKKMGKFTTEITFCTVEQQLRWEAFVRKLRTLYPGEASSGARLAAFISEHGA